MPNWVTVKVKAQNPVAFKEKFLKQFSAEELAKGENFSECDGEELPVKVDFEILKPIPQELKINSGSDSYQDEVHYYGFQKDKVEKQKTLITPLLDELYVEPFINSQEEFCDRAYKFLVPSQKSKFEEVYGKFIGNEGILNVIKGYYNYKKYGVTDWYEFSYKEWGTKWNANTLYVDVEDGYALFTTAWSCPFEIFEELSKYTSLNIAYSDEDTGANYGLYTIENGKETRYFGDNNDYCNLSGEDKIRAITSAIALESGCIEDIDDRFFGETEEEFMEQYEISKEKAVEIAQEQIVKVQNKMEELGVL